VQMLDSSGKRFLYRPTFFGMRHVVCHSGKTAHLSATHTIVLRRGHRRRTGNWNSESLKGDPRYAGLLFPIPTWQRSFHDGNAGAVHGAAIKDSDAISAAAVAHGKLRYLQGYTPLDMLVDESRITEVTVFGMLQSNLNSLDFSLLLPDVTAIADEVDGQLTQSMGG
jgi:hypothetical protein